MKKVCINIETKNDAFCEWEQLEVSRILKELASKFDGTIEEDTAIRDINGNTIGTCKIR